MPCPGGPLLTHHTVASHCLLGVALHRSRQEAAGDTEHQQQQDKGAAWSEGMGATCIACGIGINSQGFTSSAEQRQHFKTDWHRYLPCMAHPDMRACTPHCISPYQHTAPHPPSLRHAAASCCLTTNTNCGRCRYNVKRRVEKKPPVTESAFEAMLEQQDDVSAWGQHWASPQYTPAPPALPVQLPCLYSKLTQHSSSWAVRTNPFCCSLPMPLNFLSCLLPQRRLPAAGCRVQPKGVEHLWL